MTDSDRTKWYPFQEFTHQQQTTSGSNNSTANAQQYSPYAMSNNSGGGGDSTIRRDAKTSTSTPTPTPTPTTTHASPRRRRQRHGSDAAGAMPITTPNPPAAAAAAVNYEEVLSSAATRLVVPLSEEEEEVAMLSSLPQRPIANFPSQDDRKRIVGCLAIIIKTMYDYHIWDPRCPGVKNDGLAPTSNKDGNKSSNSISSNSTSNNNKNNKRSTKSADKRSDLNSCTNSTDYLLENNSFDNDSSFFEELSSHTSCTSPSPSCSTTTATTTTTTTRKASKKWRRQRNESVTAPKINNSSNHTNHHTHNNNVQQTKVKKGKLLLFQRHRNRRHFVFQKFLEETAELLFLDKCHAIAFLPMLNSLLMEQQPPPEFQHKTSSNNNTQKQQHTSNQSRPHIVRKDATPSRNVGSTTRNDHNCRREERISGGDSNGITGKKDSDERKGCFFDKSNIKEEELLLNQSSEQIFGDGHGRSNTTGVNLGMHQQTDVFDEKVFAAGDTTIGCTSMDSSTASFAHPVHYANGTPVVQNSYAEGERLNEDGGGGNISGDNAEHTIPLQTWDKNDLMQPFVESLTPGAGFQCVGLLLVNYLLRSGHGYDARIRHTIKKLAVIVIVHELKQNYYDDENCTRSSDSNAPDDDLFTERAARKFEAMEHSIAIKLLRISAVQQQKELAEKEKAKGQIVRTRKSQTVTKDAILRGLKVGSIGLAAGALFAVTGGIAAPGIVAALTASGITMAATLTSTTAVGTIFGVGGGGLIAYKTHRRTQGLTDFLFQYERKNTDSRGNTVKQDSTPDGAELFTTICLSGWLKDTKDFQRPWGVTPTNPPIDRAEKLSRFYSVYKPENVHRCQEILKKWRGDERQLWAILAQKYGRDPDHLLPLTDGPRIRAALTHEEDETLDNLLAELGYIFPHEECKETPGSLSDLLKKSSSRRHTDYPEASVNIRNETSTNPVEHSSEACNTSGCDGSQNNSEYQEQNSQKKAHKQLATTAWDYHAEYGGELYTVRWESDLLMELCDSVADMAVDLAGNAAKEILKQTALASLITAIAIPYALIRAANMIDGTWTLAIERADLAGTELARSLLESKAGHRPVVLVGFSMGARTIYACLKELARHQELWEDQQEEVNGQKDKKKKRNVVYTREPASIVEDAILLGTPNHMSHQSWAACRCVVAGRLVNCYSKTDLILSLMFQINRLSGGLRPVCGTSPIEVSGVENYDVSPFISAHSDYCTMVPHILRMVRHGLPHRPTSTIVIPYEFLEKSVTTSSVS